MNISTSEYSSGCESGWTMYLDQLSNSAYHNNNDFVTNYEEENNNGVFVVNENDDGQEDAEDLSMVSDASSGPPHSYDHENNNINNNYGGVYSQYYGYYTPDNHHEKKKGNNKLQKSKTKETKRHQNLNLDDTASSPVFDFSQGNVPPSDFSQVFTSSHYEDESMTKKHLGFFKSSTKGKSSSWLGRKRQ